MSLDVYLKRNVTDNEDATYNLVEMDHLRVNYEIYKMHNGDEASKSFRDYVEHLPTGWRQVANSDNPEWEEPNEEVYWANITHNLTDMAEAAGIYKALWRPEEIGITIASQLIEPLTKGLKLLKSAPKKYEKYNSPNGWGTYVHFVPFVEKYLAACLEFPDAIIGISR